MIIALLCLLLGGWGSRVWAQTNFGNVPGTVSATDATITKLGHLTMTMEKEVVIDPQTHLTDTLVTVKDVEWNTTPGTAKRRMDLRKATATGFENQDSSWWLDMWWFTYNYPSVNAEGEDVTLSALACMPDDDCDYVNNVIIGCHVTITSNKECPSRYTEEGSFKSDVSMLMNHAGSGLVFHSVQDDMPYYN